MNQMGAGMARGAGAGVHVPGAGLRRRGYLMVAGAAILWSTGGLIVRHLSTDGWTTIFWRGTFCALFLLVWIAVSERGRVLAGLRAMGAAGLLLALCFAAASMSFVLALQSTSVANTLIIQSTSPFIAALLGRIILKEHVRLRAWLAMACALAGVAIMVSASFGRGSLTGDLTAMIIPVAFALAVVIVRRHPQLRMVPAVALAVIIQAAIAAGFADSVAVGGRDLLLLAVFGAGQLGLGLALFVTGGRYLPAAETALICMLENILGPLWVWIVLGENPGLPAVLGGAAVLGALAVHTALDLRAPRAVPPVA
ncbi:MAG: DMT family transporter [Rhodospirillaceae bacterium]|nr:DMT family transporter [Rhodospirillaceae bacterium]